MPLNSLNSGITRVMPGNIEQAMMMLNTMPFAANRNLASAYAARMPNSSVSTVVLVDTMMLFRIAVPNMFCGANTAT